MPKAYKNNFIRTRGSFLLII